MGQKVVPITIQVNDSDKRKVEGFTNAFDEMDKSADKVSKGGFKNVFDSTTKLSTAQHTLGGESDFVKQQLALLHKEAADLSPELVKTASSATAVSTQAAGAGTALSGMLGPIALIVSLLPLLITGLSAGGQAIFNITKETAAADSKVFNLSKQLNLGAETISTISVAAQLLDKNIDSVSGGFETFEKNVAKAASGDRRLSTFFRDLNIDLTNNQTALRQMFSVLAALPTAEQQVAVATQAFGASATEVLAIVRETNGDLIEAQKQYSQLGLVISSEAARSGNEFTKQFKRIELQIDSVRRRMGDVFLPVVQEVMEKVSDHVQKNSDRWIRWGQSVVEVAKNIESGGSFIGGIVQSLEAYANATIITITHTDKFNISLEGLFGALGRYGNLLGHVISLLEAFGKAVRTVTGPSPDEIPSPLPKDFKIGDLAEKLKSSGFTPEQLRDFEKELEPFKGLFDSITARVESFGDQSAIAAVKQFQLKNSLDKLSPEVRDAAQKYLDLATAQANEVARLEAAKKANDEAQKAAERAAAANESFAAGTEAVRQRIASLTDTNGAARSELDKFRESFAKFKDRDLIKPEELKSREDAIRQLDAALTKIAENKAFEKLEELRIGVSNNLRSIREGLDFGGERATQLERVAESIERIADLKIDRSRFAGLTDLFKGDLNTVNLEQAQKRLHELLNLNPDVGANVTGEQEKHIIDLLYQAAQADRALTAASTPLAVATRQLKEDIRDLNSELENGPQLDSLRIQRGILENIIDLRHRDVDAIIEQDRALRELADAEQFHGQQARAIVLDHLAQTRSQTQVFADFIIDTYDSINDAVYRGVEKLTGGIKAIDSLIAGLITRLTNRLFQKLLDVLIPTGSGGAAASGGGNFFSGLFGGGAQSAAGGSLAQFAGLGGGITSPQQGQAAALAQIFGGGGGGITAPVSLTSQLAQQASFSGAIQQAGGATWKNFGASLGTPLNYAGPSFGSQIGGLVAGIAPLLGVTLGARLGGSSRLGSILGGVGGGVAGLGVAALLGSSTAAGLLGTIGSLGGLLPFTVAVPFLAAPLIVGAILLARNAARRRDETTRNSAMVDALGQLNQILAAVKRDQMDGGSAIASALQIRQQYVTSMQALKDSKTRNIALADVSRLDAVIAQIRGEADLQLKRQETDKRLVPEFASGGYTPDSLSLIKVRPGEFILPPGAQQQLAANGGFIPGRDLGYDNTFMLAPANSLVVPKVPISTPAAAAPAIAASRFGGGLAEAGPIQVEVHINAPGVDPEKILVAGVKTSGGREAVVKLVKIENKDGAFRR